MLQQRTVKVAATKVGVRRGAQHAQLALAEGNHRNLVVGVANVHEHDTPRVLRLRQVSLGDTVAQRGGGGLVQQAQRVQVRDLRRVQQRTALQVGEPDRHREHHVAHGRAADLVLGGVTQLTKVHGQQLRGGEHLLLAGVHHLDADLAAGVHQLGVHERLLELLHHLVLERAADQALERADRVLEVGRLRRGSALTEGTRLGAERHQRGRAAVAHLIRHNVDATSARNADPARVSTSGPSHHAWTYLLLLLPISKPTTLDMMSEWSGTKPSCFRAAET